MFNSGTLTLTNDTVTGNHVSATASGASGDAVADGGGVFNADGGTLLVTALPGHQQLGHRDRHGLRQSPRRSAAG